METLEQLCVQWRYSKYAKICRRPWRNFNYREMQGRLGSFDGVRGLVSSVVGLTIVLLLEYE